jgi:hypothetical protein
MPLIIDDNPPGSGIRDTLPSAPAVVLPTTIAFGAARNAIAVYSAWLCDTSSTRITIFPEYRGEAGCSDTGDVQ